MAFSTCGKCEGRYFELVEVRLTGSMYAYNFIQCSRCGTPVGVVEYLDSGVLLQEQKAQLNQIEKRLQNIEYNLEQILRQR